ncbi:MAG: peptidoglycan DD-metalloendopeptidase family protein [Chloroflexota bacterium]
MVRHRSPRSGVLRAALAAGLLAAALAPAVGWAPPARAADSAVVSNPDGINLRESPGYDGAILGTLDDGTWLGLRTGEFDTVLDADGETRWWPVSSPLGDGWVAGFSLVLDGGDGEGAAQGDATLLQWQPSGEEAASGSGEPSIDAVDGEYTGGEMAWVSEEGGANFRAEPGIAGEVLWSVGYGTEVMLRLASSETVWADGNRWWPVSIGDSEGWIAGETLSPIDLPAASPDLPETVEDESAGTVVGDGPATSESATSGSLMSWAKVLTDDRAGLNLRADPAPDAERIGAAEEFEVVEVLQGPQTDPAGNGWYLVRSGGVTGWAFGDYLEDASYASAPASGSGLATGTFMYPVKRFTFTQGYGCSQYWWHYGYNAAWGCHVHNGIDLAAPYGTPVMAADGGVVTEAGWCDCGLGWYVKLDHENGFETGYGHLSEYAVEPGATIRKGEIIGYMGSSGNSTGSHLHFMVEYLGVTYNPFNYLP